MLLLEMLQRVRGAAGPPPGLGAPTWVAVPCVPFSLLLYSCHIPPQILVFFLLAVYERSEKKVWQKNGGSGMLMVQELAILGFRKCLVPGGPLNQQGNGEGSTKDPVPCLDTKCT